MTLLYSTLVTALTVGNIVTQRQRRQYLPDNQSTNKRINLIQVQGDRYISVDLFILAEIAFNSVWEVISIYHLCVNKTGFFHQ